VLCQLAAQEIELEIQLLMQPIDVTARNEQSAASGRPKTYALDFTTTEIS
jgi:hypothetical protein